ncbi:hypothetical protein MRX96_003088 [Rhipicephalus microplus]
MPILAVNLLRPGSDDDNHICFTSDNDSHGAPLHMLGDATRTSVPDSDTKDALDRMHERTMTMCDTETEKAMDDLHEATMVEPLTMTETEEEVSAVVLKNTTVTRKKQWTQWETMMAEDYNYARTVPASKKCKIFAPTLTEAHFLFYTGV